MVSRDGALDIPVAEQRLSFIEGVKSTDVVRVLPWLFNQLEFNKDHEFIRAKSELIGELLKMFTALQTQTIDVDKIKAAASFLDGESKELWDFANKVDFITLSKPERGDEVYKKIEVLTNRLKQILENKE